MRDLSSSMHWLLTGVSAWVLVASTGCASGPSSSVSAGDATVLSRSGSLRGEWTLMRFLGGPPSRGQITDTMHWNGAANDRHLRIERSRAGVPGDVVCEVDAPDDKAWNDLLSALSDSDLQRALSHPDRVPALTIDAGYFACSRGQTHIAVSDVPSADSSAAREIAALRRLSSAYSRLHDEVVAARACAFPETVSDQGT